MNRASLLNYYRLFSRAKTAWEQVLARNAAIGEAEDGLGIALQGMGAPSAPAAFARGTAKKLPPARFAQGYHEAARAAVQGAAGAEKCLSKLSDVESKGLQGFEKSSFEHLKRVCELWKSEKST